MSDDSWIYKRICGDLHGFTINFPNLTFNRKRFFGGHGSTRAQAPRALQDVLVAGGVPKDRELGKVWYVRNIDHCWLVVWNIFFFPIYWE